MSVRTRGFRSVTPGRPMGVRSVGPRQGGTVVGSPGAPAGEIFRKAVVEAGQGRGRGTPRGWGEGWPGVLPGAGKNLLLGRPGELLPTSARTSVVVVMTTTPDSGKRCRYGDGWATGRFLRRSPKDLPGRCWECWCVGSVGSVGTGRGTDPDSNTSNTSNTVLGGVGVELRSQNNPLRGTRPVRTPLWTNRKDRPNWTTWTTSRDPVRTPSAGRTATSRDPVRTPRSKVGVDEGSVSR